MRRYLKDSFWQKKEFWVSTATCSDKLSKRCSPLSSTNKEVNNSFLAPIVDPWSRSIPTCKIRLPDWIESPSWKHRPDDFSLKYFKDLVGSKCRYYCRNILEATMNLCIGILLPECTSLWVSVCWLKSLHANLYMQNTVHDSPSSAPFLCSREGKQRNTLNFFFRFRNNLSPFFAAFMLLHLKTFNFLEI